MRSGGFRRAKHFQDSRIPTPHTARHTREGVRCVVWSNPARIVAPLARRDERPAGDWVGILVDSYYDRRTAFEFAVNPAGVRRDVYRYNDYKEAPSWDAACDVVTTRDAGGWSAEFRIPFSQLRFCARAAHRFGFNVYREIGRAREIQYWRPLPLDQHGVVSCFGDLTGLAGLRCPAGSRVQIPPSRQESAASAVGRIRLTGEKGVFWIRCIEDWLVGAIPGIVDLRGENRPTLAILIKKFCRLHVRPQRI